MAEPQKDGKDGISMKTIFERLLTRYQWLNMKTELLLFFILYQSMF
jgi:hypothetical protein